MCLYCYFCCCVSLLHILSRNVVGNRGFLHISFGNLTGEMYEGRAVAERFGVEVTSNDKKLKETLMKTVKDALSERGVL